MVGRWHLNKYKYAIEDITVLTVYKQNKWLRLMCKVSQRYPGVCGVGGVQAAVIVVHAGDSGGEKSLSETKP